VEVVPVALEQAHHCQSQQVQNIRLPLVLVEQAVLVVLVRLVEIQHLAL
jgi:hypothetical protein